MTCNRGQPLHPIYLFVSMLWLNTIESKIILGVFPGEDRTCVLAIYSLNGRGVNLLQVPQGVLVNWDAADCLVMVFSMPSAILRPVSPERPLPLTVPFPGSSFVWLPWCGDQLPSAILIHMRGSRPVCSCKKGVPKLDSAPLWWTWYLGNIGFIAEPLSKVNCQSICLLPRVRVSRKQICWLSVSKQTSFKDAVTV